MALMLGTNGDVESFRLWLRIFLPTRLHGGFGGVPWEECSHRPVGKSWNCGVEQWLIKSL